MNQCPQCGRKLLSQASARCNWCGHEIQDAAYQASAETEREAFFARQAAHDAQSLAAIRAINVNANDPTVNAYDPLLPMSPLLGGPLTGASPRRAANARERSRQDLAIQRAVEQALADQRQEEAARRATPLPLSPSGFPQRPGVTQTPPTAIAESTEEAPDATDERFRHLEL